MIKVRACLPPGRHLKKSSELRLSQPRLGKVGQIYDGSTEQECIVSTLDDV